MLEKLVVGWQKENLVGERNSVIHAAPTTTLSLSSPHSAFLLPTLFDTPRGLGPADPYMRATVAGGSWRVIKAEDFFLCRYLYMGFWQSNCKTLFAICVIFASTYVDILKTKIYVSFCYTPYLVIVQKKFIEVNG